MDMDFAMFQQMLNQKETEKNVAARFYDKAVKTEEVAANGLPIFKNVTYIEIRLKDNNTETGECGKNQTLSARICLVSAF